jgi:hypothetical protein
MHFCLRRKIDFVSQKTTPSDHVSLALRGPESETLCRRLASLSELKKINAFGHVNSSRSPIQQRTATLRPICPSKAPT